jgi:hypothetical protein
MYQIWSHVAFCSVRNIFSALMALTRLMDTALAVTTRRLDTLRFGW